MEIVLVLKQHGCVTPHQAVPPSSSSPPSVGPPDCRVDPPGLEERFGHGRDTGGRTVIGQTHTVYSIGNRNGWKCV